MVLRLSPEQLLQDLFPWAGLQSRRSTWRWPRLAPRPYFAFEYTLGIPRESLGIPRESLGIPRES